MMRDEHSIWNRLVHGNPYRLVPVDTEPGLSEAGQLDEKMESEKPKFKRVTLEPYKYAHPSDELKVKKYLYFFNVCFVILICCLGNFFGRAVFLRRSVILVGKLGHEASQHVQMSNQSSEIISLAYPFIPKASYGEPVYSKLLINQTFDSWGCPAVEKFTPPEDTDYNKVVLTLNVSVDGFQFDRLGHLYVGGAEIWRTSTIEPGSRSVYSSFKKDVTEYVSLFQEETDIVFELNNLLLDRLTGAFDVQLSADFYLSEYFHSAEEEALDESSTSIASTAHKDEVYKYFDVRGAATKVFPAIKNNTASYPQDQLVMKLPKVPQNTTRLKLNIFASGSFTEENWYSNVLDKFVDRFESDGTIFDGHGPLRFVTVWLDGKKLASQSPQPFIFTSGFSPSLWRAVVPTNAFDLASVDLDISPILPYLWDSEDHELRISIENGIDELDGGESSVGSDWILSANLLTYEKPEIKSASGSVLHLADTKDGKSFGVSVPYTNSLVQDAKGKFETEVTGELLVELNNGEIFNATMTSFFSGAISNLQDYRHSGFVADVVHKSTSLKSFSLIVNEEEIRSSDIKLHYFLTFANSRTTVEEGDDINVSLVSVKVLDLDVDKKPAMKETETQKGKSVHHFRESCDFGAGNLTTKFKSEVHGPDYGFVYKRKVKVEDDKIIMDKDSFVRE